MGFPCNQFGAQEPKGEDEILEFVTSNYDVTFPMFAKIEVNGDNAAPLFQYLKQEAPDDGGPSDVKWNFEKFLVDGQGKVLKRYRTPVTPEEIARDLASHL